jgi:hypothetical protein
MPINGVTAGKDGRTGIFRPRSFRLCEDVIRVTPLPRLRPRGGRNPLRQLRQLLFLA